nr:GtrA family protein [Nocardia brasiliensis]
MCGALSIVVDFSVLLTLLHSGLPFAAAKTFSFVVGTSIAYTTNRRWTFQTLPSRTRFLAVAALSSLMFGVQIGISTGLYAALPTGIVFVLAAFAIAQSVETTINFIVQREWIFNSNRIQSSDTHEDPPDLLRCHSDNLSCPDDGGFAHTGE